MNSRVFLPVATNREESVSRPGSSRLCGDSVWWWIAVGLLYWAVIFALQGKLLALDAEFGLHPDEPGHYLAGLMIRDYLASGMSVSPMAYATHYYRHYPNLAIGVWPPGFYVLEALWMLIAGISRAGVLHLIALVSSCAGVAVAYWSTAVSNRYLGAVAGLLFLTLPATRDQYLRVSPDLLAVLFMCTAALAFAKYTEATTASRAAVFGTLSAIGILIKPAVAAIALIPPLFIITTKRFSMIRTLHFWLPPCIVLAVAGPWQVATYGLSHATFVGDFGPAFTAEAVPVFLGEWWTQLTPFGIAVISVGILSVRRDRKRSQYFHTAWALSLAVLVFHSLVPGNIEERYMIPAYAGAAVLFSAGALALLHRRTTRRVQVVGLLAMFSILLLCVNRSFQRDHLEHIGLRAAVQTAFAPPWDRAHVILVSSNNLHEGALVAEAAMAERASRPHHAVLRADKVLATMDWHGRNYTARATTTEGIGQLLSERGVTQVLLEAVPGWEVFPHHELLSRTLQADTSNWQMVTAPVSLKERALVDRNFRLFRKRSGPTEPSPSRLIGPPVRGR